MYGALVEGGRRDSGDSEIAATGEDVRLNATGSGPYAAGFVLAATVVGVRPMVSGSRSLEAGSVSILGWLERECFDTSIN